MIVSAVLFLGFILGIISVLAIEGLLILILIKHLSKGNNSNSNSDRNGGFIDPSQQLPLDSPQQFAHSLYQKQGVVWVLETERIPKLPSAAEQSKKKEVLEVSPIRKHAKIQDRTLIITEADGSLTKILLKGCQVVAVSASSLPTKKWAKLYPIKVESKNSVLYKGSKVFYIYAETSWEKESWCKALRLASSNDREKLQWHSKLSEEFNRYLNSLSEAYPSLIKPSVGFHGGISEKVNRIEDPPSKVRQLWRKLSKKTSLPNHDEKRNADRAWGLRTLASVPSISKSTVAENECLEDITSVSSDASFHLGSSTHLSEMSDADAREKFVDEGTLCLNLLSSRLFFDIKNNLDIKIAVKDRIQKTLTNMRIPSYIGEVILTDMDLGHLPPYIHGMRAIPADMNDLWALELDVEYSGGLVLYIEARLEVGELDSQSGTIHQNIESIPSGEVPVDLLEDFKHLQEELNLSGGESSQQLDVNDHKFDKLSGSKSGVSTSSTWSRWKSILNSVAKHVSQVPLTLAVKVSSLKGTIQLHVRPPPSDQLWFGFTSMPNIHFHLESSVKDHKITNGRIASFLISRIKASIKETLVLPNCESINVPWMLAEKDDWVPQSTAPLLRVNRDLPSDTTSLNEDFDPQPTKPKPMDRDLDIQQAKQKKMDSHKPPVHNKSSSESSNPVNNELQIPLLQNGEETQGRSLHPKEETLLLSYGSHSPSRYVSLTEENEDDDAKRNKGGKKSRMLDLRKKMSEKIEEKRRNIEEKSRTIVEKMRGP